MTWVMIVMKMNERTDADADGRRTNRRRSAQTWNLSASKNFCSSLTLLNHKVQTVSDSVTLTSSKQASRATATASKKKQSTRIGNFFFTNYDRRSHFVNLEFPFPIFLSSQVRLNCSTRPRPSFQLLPILFKFENLQSPLVSCLMAVIHNHNMQLT